jgi:hypothetical protein
MRRMRGMSRERRGMRIRRRRRRRRRKKKKEEEEEIVLCYSYT